MGCVATKLEEEGEVVGICRDRKRLLKQAVERRRALAAAHFNYCQALYAVSAAVKLFVARHASPSSPFLITFPSSSPAPEDVADGTTTTAMFLQQKPSESTSKSEAVGCPSCVSSESSDEEEEGHNVLVHAGEQQPYGYRYYMQTTMAPPMPSPPRDFGWDFFNLFDAMRPEGYTKTCYNEDLRVVRQQEGIPELEEEDEEEEKEEDKKMVEGEVVVSSSSSNGKVVVKDDNCCLEEEKHGSRELLEALRDIESHFIKAYHSGKHVCTMLEASTNHLQSPPPHEFKVNPTKLIQAITWHRSASFNLTGSCKSLVASSSTWSEYKNDLFDDYGGMVSGSHSLTLDRLYAWEKKLYEEVKAGDGVRKLYEKKCVRMRNQDVRVDNRFKPDKTRAAVKDLYARILVSIRSAESISGKIDKLRDEELHPQIIELLKGMTKTWKTMLETHETQKKILSEVGTFDCPLYEKLCNDSHRLATLQLEAELHNWRSCLAQYVTAQKSYVQTLHSWLAKFLPPEVQLYSPTAKRASSGPYRTAGPGLLPVCHDWLNLLENLPDKSVGFALKSFAKDLRGLRAVQGEELQQKRKVEAIAKELEKRTQAFNKIETPLLEYNADEEKRDEPDPVEALRMRVQVEREKHQRFVQEAKRATLTGFRAGFCAVFDSLTEFGIASHKMYNEIADKSAGAAGGLLESSGAGVADHHHASRR